MRIEPFKLVCELIVALKDDDGNVVGEQKAADMVVYAPHLDEIREKVEAIMPEIQREWDQR